MLTHTRSCPALTPGNGPCTCGLEFRIQLQTEQTMHAAWRKRAEEAEQKTEQQVEELYKRAFDDGAMATQTHLEGLRVSQLDGECERLRTVNRDLNTQVQRWIDKASQLEQQNKDLRTTRDHIENQLTKERDRLRTEVELLTIEKTTAVAANKDEFEAHKLTISDYQTEIRKLQAQRVSKHSRIFTEADGSSFLGKE